VDFEQQEVCRNNKEECFKEVEGVGFDPRLVVDEDRYEERKEHDVADDYEWQIGDGAFAEVGKGDAAHGK